MTPICGTPKCKKPCIEDRRFCQECSDNLARIKVELADDPRLLFNRKSGHVKSNRRTKMPPTCCWPGCWDIRIPPDPYCEKGAEGH